MMSRKRNSDRFQPTHRSRRETGRKTLWAVIAGLVLCKPAQSTQAATATWLNPVDGSWTDSSKWSTNPLVPNNGNGGGTYDVTVDASGQDYSIDLNSNITVDSFTVNSINAIIRGYGLLQVAGTANITQGSYYLQGGTIKGGVWNVDNAASLRIDASLLNLLDGVAVNGDIRLNDENASVRISGGTTFTTAHLKGSSTILGFSPGQTLTGTVLFEGTDPGERHVSMDGTSGSLTVGASGAIRTASDLTGAYINHIGTGYAGSMNLVNQGLISSETAGQIISIESSTVANTGTLRALNGGILHIAPASPWTNGGTISLDGSSVVNLHGTFNATGGIGTFSNPSGGAVNITGTVNNAGNTLALGNSTGSWTLLGGSIQGGGLTFADGKSLIITNNDSNLLDGVAVNGDLHLQDFGSRLRIGGGTTFTAAHLAGENSALGFAPGQTLTGTVLFEGGNSRDRYVDMNGTAGTLTVGATGSIRTTANLDNAGYSNRIGAGGVYGGAMSLVNQGLISSETAGRTLSIESTSLTNSGTLRAINGGTLTVAAQNWTNSGTISLDGSSTINLGGTLDATGGIGAFSNATGGTVNITGTVLNTGNHLMLNSATGAWNLAGGTIRGGSISSADGKDLHIRPFFSNLLDGVSVNGDIVLSEDSARLRTANGTAFNAVHLSGRHSTLAFAAGETLGGTVWFEGGSAGNRHVTMDSNPGSLTIGTSGSIRTGADLGNTGFLNRIGADGTFGGLMNLVNQGVISSETAGQTVTIESASLVNSGTLQALNGGTLYIIPSAAWTNTGTITLDASSTVNLGGVFNATGGIGTFSNPAGGSVNIMGILFNGGNTFTLNNSTGSWSLAGGTVRGGSVSFVDGKNLLISSDPINLLDEVAVNGDIRLEGSGAALRLDGGTTFATAHLSGSASTLAFAPGETLANTVLFEGTAAGDRFISMDGTSGTLTIGASGVIKTAADLNNAGSLSRIGVSPAYTGAMRLVNRGLISSETAGQTISIESARFTNAGVLQALNGGSLNLSTDLLNYDAATSTLNGGTWKAVSGNPGLPTTLALNQGGGGIINNKASVTLSGTGSIFTEINSLANNQGSLTLADSRDFTTQGSLTNSGTLALQDAGTDLTVSGDLTNTATGRINLGGGQFSALSLTNSGTLSGFGTVTSRPVNHGTIRSSGGALIFTDGIQGGSGTVQINAGSSLDLSGGVSGSSADYLIHNGNTPGSLNLGANHFEVAVDYTNARAGSGNAYNPRANITGTGGINAAGDVTQILAGDVTDGGTPNARLDFGNVHVGRSATLGYQVGNGGTTGPALRGAIQTAAGGGTITDSRLSGSGVTAGNFGPVAAGILGGGLSVTFAPDTAGPLSGQMVGIVNNFDNVADQSLSITGTAYRLAAPGVQGGTSADFGIVHVGDTVIRTLTIANTAAADGFSESLSGSFSGSTAGIITGGGFVQLASGASSGFMTVGLNTSAAASVSGTATLAFLSDGAGTSGLGQTALPDHILNVSGQINNYANPAFVHQSGQGILTRTSGSTFTLDFGTIGNSSLEGTPVITLGLLNDVSGPSDTLAGTFLSSLSSFTAGNFGAFNGIGAGQTLDGLTISLDNSVNGVFTGSIMLSAAGQNSGGYDGSLGNYVLNLTATVVPEPSPGTLLLLLTGPLLPAVRRRRRQP